MKTAVLIALLALFAVPRASAQARTGTELLTMCDSNDLQEQNACMFYLGGVLQGVTLAGSSDYFNAPSDVTLTQCRLIVVKYLKEHPNQLHRSGVALVVRSFHDAFPPRKS